MFLSKTEDHFLRQGVATIASSVSGDFVALYEAVAFDSGSMNGAMECVNMTVNRDGLVESEEEFTVELMFDSSKGCLNLGNNVTVVTLLDSDSMFFS